MCWFCETESLIDKVRDHCHLTGSYRGPTHNKCNNNVTQKQSKLFPFALDTVSIYDSIFREASR